MIRAGTLQSLPERVSQTAMFPPPDPCESYEYEPEPGTELLAPIVIHLCGPATPASERLADRILELRPGALFVVYPA
jgi:hypothetical protein